MTLVSGSIRFTWIFAGVLWRGGIKRQWGNQKCRFSGILDATSSAPWEMRPTLLYTIIYSLVAFPLTPTYMTLSDLDWLFRAKFCFRASLAGWHCATSENSCVKMNEDRQLQTETVSGANLQQGLFSFWHYKVCADIWSDSLERRR